MERKHVRLLMVLVAFLGMLWGFNNQSASASGKITKLAVPSMAKPVHLKVNYLYGTRYGYQDTTTGTRMKLDGLTNKMRIGKYAKRVFFVYRQATVKRGSKRLVYYYVTDKDKMVGGWVHRSKVTNVKKVGYIKEFKTVYNIIKNNATAWSFKQAKLILGDTNPSYPYGDKAYSHNIGGGQDVLPYIGDSHLGDLVVILGYGMQKHHNNLGNPPFDETSAMKDGHTLLLLYRYYQGRGTHFKSNLEGKFEEEINDVNALNNDIDGTFNPTVHGFEDDLKTHIDQLDSEYN